VISRFGIFHRDVIRVRSRVSSKWRNTTFVESGDHQSAKSDEKTSSSCTRSGTPLKSEVSPLDATRMGDSEVVAAKGMIYMSLLATYAIDFPVSGHTA